MRPLVTLDRFSTPDGHTLTLHQRDQDFFIHIDGEELMSTRRTGSETALARLACGALTAMQRPRALIGGLGMGYTLRSALDVLPKHAVVVVAELFPKVAAWHRSHLAHLQSGALEDRRTELALEDVWRVLDRGPWDAIMLDVDNGPGAASNCLARNGRLYAKGGLERIRCMLAPGGTLAVWSAYPDPSYADQLRRFGFDVSTERVHEQGNKGARHAVFVARIGATRASRRCR